MTEEVPEVKDEDFELLEAAAALPDALYGSRLYSNTAMYALAKQREMYEAKLAELEAKLSALASSVPANGSGGVEGHGGDGASRPLRQDNRGLVAAVFALVLAICALVALNLPQRQDQKRSGSPRVASVAQKPQRAQPTMPEPPSRRQSAGGSGARVEDTSPMIAPRETTVQAAGIDRIEEASIQDSSSRSLATQPPTETSPPAATPSPQLALADKVSEDPLVERADERQDDTIHSEPTRLANRAPDAARRFRARDALHALRMR